MVMRENNEIIGHLMCTSQALTNTGRMIPEMEEDRQILNKLAGGKKDLVELHESG